jgi:N,N-dimethylformamidase beta subunit-like protein
VSSIRDVPRAPALVLALLAVLVAAGTAGGGADRTGTTQHGLGLVFEKRSYRPGHAARLDLWTPVAGSLRIRVYQAGSEALRGHARDKMWGVPRGDPLVVRNPHGTVTVRLGHWVSGLYFVRAVSGDGRVGYAPFVLRPARLGTYRVAVVLPTNTWEAYNLLDADGDGVGDSWYADPKIHAVDLRRPYSDHGVPRWYASYNAGFLHWLAHSGFGADVLSDDDLDSIRSGSRLARLYDLVVFAGHEEYVTPHVYRMMLRFRNRGGNLAFLSANNFFYRVTRSGHVLHGRRRWRDLGRPEASLVGVQYAGYDEHSFANAPYRVTRLGAARWLFRGTGLHNGSRFGNYGIEIDARAPSSPHGLRILARVPNVFGAGQSAEMSYYTRHGAKVFAAGTLNFGSSAELPVASRMLTNLWERLSRR